MWYDQNAQPNRTQKNAKNWACSTGTEISWSRMVGCCYAAANAVCTTHIRINTAPVFACCLQQEIPEPFVQSIVKTDFKRALFVIVDSFHSLDKLFCEDSLDIWVLRKNS